jgi:hypothetical protein
MTSDSDQLLESIRAEFASSRQISKLTIVKVLSTGDLRLNCEVVHHLLDSALPNGRMRVDECWELIVDTLSRCLRREVEHPDVFSNFEAAAYARRLLEILWHERQKHRTQLQEFRDWLETLLRSADTRQREAILLGFLEHVLQDPKIDGYFSCWEQEPVLAAVLAEGRQLAKGFQDLAARRGRDTA